MAAANLISPLILSVNQTLTPGQNLIPVDQLGATGNSKSAMLIDGIRIRVDELAAFVARVGAVIDLRGAFSVGVSVGRIDLTRQVIPMALYGRVKDSAADFGSLLNPTGQYYPAAFPGQSLHTIWRFKKPFYIAPQKHIAIKLYWNASLTPQPGVVSPNTVNVTVSLFGRALPENYPVPATVYVPYMTSFVPGPVLNTATPTVLKSVPNDLGNPYKEELRLTRFTGFCNSFTAGAAGEDVSTGLAFVLARMTEYRGATVIRDQTPFYGAFDLNTRAWDVDCVLPRGGYYSTMLNLGNMGGFAAGYNSQPMIGLQGYRALTGQSYMGEVG